MTAFARFQSRNENAILYLHTNIHPQLGHGGYPLMLLAERLNIPEKNLLFCHQTNYAMGLPSSYVAEVYKASDVLLSPSMGEGFGLPIVEAQACGCAVITQDCSSMPELTFNGIAIPKGQIFWRSPCDWQYTPRIEDIEAALEAIYNASDEQREMAAAGAIAMIDNNYSYGVVAQRYWKPFMEHVERTLKSDEG